jgi:hypothetical protein
MSMSMSMSMAMNNLNPGAMATDVPRFNSEDYPKYAPATPVVRWPMEKYSKDWDPELRTWRYVQEFIGIGSVITGVRNYIESYVPYGTFHVPSSAIVPPFSQANLEDEVLGVLNASIDRADRALEILSQANGIGAINYWTGMLRIDRSKHKNTFLLILVALKIGEFVAMRLKNIYRMRRPAQVYPLIMPLIDGPDTPSFPSSHSLQAHLITGVLKLALNYPASPPLPAPGPLLPGPPTAPVTTTSDALDVLAFRVARNREIAGVHYPMDSQAGLCGALKCLDYLSGLPAGGPFQKLLDRAAHEDVIKGQPYP